MPSTPDFLVVPFRDQLQDPIGIEFQHLTDTVNTNFAAPLAPVPFTANYTEFTPEPLKSEIQSLVSQLNISFGQIAASTVATPVVLQNPEQIQEPYLGSLLYFVSATNLGLATLFP